MSPCELILHLRSLPEWRHTPKDVFAVMALGTTDDTLRKIEQGHAPRTEDVMRWMGVFVKANPRGPFSVTLENGFVLTHPNGVKTTTPLAVSLSSMHQPFL